MKHDGSYSVLQVTNVLRASTIHAKRILLDDATIESKPSMAAEAIQKAYETLRDTNRFTDLLKSSIETLTKTFRVYRSSMLGTVLHVTPDVTVVEGTQFVSLKHANQIDDSSMPDNTMCTCLDSHGELMYKLKVGNQVRYASIPTFQPHVNASVKVDGNGHVAVNLWEEL